MKFRVRIHVKGAAPATFNGGMDVLGAYVELSPSQRDGPETIPAMRLPLRVPALLQSSGASRQEVITNVSNGPGELSNEPQGQRGTLVAVSHVWAMKAVDRSAAPGATSSTGDEAGCGWLFGSR